MEESLEDYAKRKVLEVMKEEKIDTSNERMYNAVYNNFLNFLKEEKVINDFHEKYSSFTGMYSSRRPTMATRNWLKRFDKDPSL